ncbi:MAG: hypothetical protein IKP65_04490 [Alphaproteobacteria bacterium]|nr:hypothetical protein [Alphaproteobacteria bacterium]
MILPSDVIRELLKYTAFFQESFVQIGGKYRRSWRYKDDEPSFLAGKVVFVIEPQYDNTIPECRLFDYSSIITAKITDENYLDFVNSLDLSFKDIKDLKKDEMLQILANNAMAANKAPKLELLVNKRKEIDTMF